MNGVFIAFPAGDLQHLDSFHLQDLLGSPCSVIFAFQVFKEFFILWILFPILRILFESSTAFPPFHPFSPSFSPSISFSYHHFEFFIRNSIKSFNYFSRIFSKVLSRTIILFSGRFRKGFNKDDCKSETTGSKKILSESIPENFKFATDIFEGSLCRCFLKGENRLIGCKVRWKMVIFIDEESRWIGED